MRGLERRQPRTVISVKRRVEILERRKQVADLVKQKFTYDEIAEMLQIGRRTVVDDMNALRDEWRENRIDDINEVYMLDLVNLNRLERLFWRRLDQLKKDPRAGSRWAEMLLRLYERRARMMGYDAADKRERKLVEVEVIDKKQKDAAIQAMIKSNKLLEEMCKNRELPNHLKKPELIDDSVIDVKARKV